MRKSDPNFMFVFIMKKRKSIVENAKLSNTAPFSACSAPLREDILELMEAAY